MDEQDHSKTTEAFEKALQEPDTNKYLLRLFVAGLTSRSSKAIETIRELCERELQGRYELEVIDIYQQPEMVKDEQVLVAPTLVKELPLPLRKVIGDLTNSERVLVGLDLRPKQK